MDVHQQQHAEQACRDLVLAITQYGDHRQTEQAVALFATAGTWLRGGKLLRGQQEILDSYTHGSTTPVMRHIIGGTLVSMIDEDHARSVSYYVALRHDPKRPDPTFPLPFDPPFSMGEWHDTFVRTEHGWRFASRETRRLFERAGGAA